MPTLLLALLLAHISIQQTLAADMGAALKADSITAEPFNDAKTVGNLARGDSIEIISKKGAWLQIKAKKTTGWVRLLSIKRNGTNVSNAKGILDVASGRAGTGQVVSTTGIRGLSAEELKSAKFSEGEMKLLESYAQNVTEAQSFANAGQLQANKIPYFTNATNSKGAQ